jgi:hypothetical protein
MEEIALARINSFAHVAQQVDVPSSEEPIFVLTGSQLQEIISRAVLEATEPLYREIAYDRQRIAKLEQREPQPLQRDNGNTLRAILAANNGKMYAKNAREQMHLKPWTFSKLLASMKNYIEIKPCSLKGKRNQNLLVLKSKLVACNMQLD